LITASSVDAPTLDINNFTQEALVDKVRSLATNAAPVTF
jgi:hypothetical protein